jgi:hypothetical protein
MKTGRRAIKRATLENISSRRFQMQEYTGNRQGRKEVKCFFGALNENSCNSRVVGKYLLNKKN